MKNSKEVVKPATCKRCGDPLLGFAKSKAGKPMPVVAHVEPMVEQITVKASAPFEFHVCIADRTPRQVDETLAEIHEARVAAVGRALALEAEHERTQQRVDEGRPLYGRSIEEIEQQQSDVHAWLTKLGAWRDFFEAEFDRRGGWLRYFLVTSSVGHVHRGMDCSTCHATTTYAWIVNLADCDEAKMIEEYGTKACTTCFPNAPAHPAWIEAQHRAEAEAARVCPGSGVYVGFGSGRKYVTCDRCGATVAKTKNGNVRKHKAETIVSMGVE
jgi:hypothetical protein